jgi:hypothetical protein
MEQLTQVLADTLQAIRQSAGRSSLPTTTAEIPRFDPLQEDNGAVKRCEEVDKLAETFQWTGCELLARATSGLTGEAKTWFLSWQPEAKSWENLKTELCNLYPPKKNLSERFRKAGLYTSENATSYCEYARQKILLLRALNFNLSERTMLELVVGDITDAQVKIAAFNSKVETIADLLTLLSQYELTTAAESSFAKRVKRTDPVESGQQSKLCYTCNKPGHLSRFCPKIRNRETKNESKPFGKNVNCSFCGKAGHFANRCFLKQRREKQSGPANVRCFSVKLDDEFCTEFIIQGMKVNCLIDTGAECSLISSRVAKKLACHLEPDFTMLRGIGGTEGKLTTEYFCQNDILYRKINPGQNPPIYRAFVPKGSRLGVLRMFHDEQCHVDPDKTFAKINHFFWFPGMAKFVKKYCDHCLKCIAGKKHTGPKQGSLHPIDKIPDPFHTVHADCVGPFPVTPEGFKHLLLLIDAFTKYLFLIPLKTAYGTRDTRQVENLPEYFSNNQAIYLRSRYQLHR